MKYSDINLKLNTDYNTISILPGVDINIINYLPVEDKNDIIQIALQQSEEDGIYNLLKVEMFLHLYTVYMYTDIEFTEEEKSDPAKLYNELASTGVLKAIINTIPATEWEYILDTLTKTMDLKLKYKQTLASVLNGFINNLPVNAKNAMEIINKFNPADFQKVIDFATAANGGRPID
jgi:hypothetical protein